MTAPRNMGDWKVKLAPEASFSLAEKRVDCAGILLAFIIGKLDLPASEPNVNFIMAGVAELNIIGQCPDVLSAAVMHNLVISARELCASGIPDRQFREFGLPFQPGKYTHHIGWLYYAASPIAHLNHVKTPVSLLLDEDDLHISPTQGTGYYYVSKSKGRAVDMLAFPRETHPFDGAEAKLGVVQG